MLILRYRNKMNYSLIYLHKGWLVLCLLKCSHPYAANLRYPHKSFIYFLHPCISSPNDHRSDPEISPVIIPMLPKRQIEAIYTLFFRRILWVFNINHMKCLSIKLLFELMTLAWKVLNSNTKGNLNLKWILIKSIFVMYSHINSHSLTYLLFCRSI